MFKLLSSFVLLSLSITVYSQSAELELTMNYQGIEEGYIPGQQRTFNMTVSNNGPDPAIPNNGDFFFITTESIGSDDQWVPYIFFELDELNSPSECTFSSFFIDPLPGMNPHYAYAFFINQLDPFESITCNGFSTVFYLEGEQTVNWSITNPWASDPDLSNNNIEVTFGLRPIAVPTMSKSSIILLIVIFLMTMVFYMHRESQIKPMS